MDINISSQQLADRLVPQLPCLRLEQLVIDGECITIKLTISTPKAKCPLCTAISTQIHSSHVRTLADLPWGGYTVRLQLTVRKFFCKLATCVRRIFAERLPELVAPYARRSARLSLIIRLVGLALGGQGGECLTARLGMAVSSSTLLRHIRRAPAPSNSSIHAPKPPRVIGIDDFAFLKGRRYGTILIDLEQHLRQRILVTSRTSLGRLVHSSGIGNNVCAKECW
jgi:transposase